MSVQARFIGLRLMVAGALCCCLVACGDDEPTAPETPFSTKAGDYLWQGGIGTVWEYSFEERATDTNGVTTQPDQMSRIRITLIDTGITRKGVAGLTVYVQEGFIGSVVDDTDTLYYSRSTDSVFAHRLPLHSRDGMEVVLAGPLTVGSRFRRFPTATSPGDTATAVINAVNVLRQTPAGTFRTVQTVSTNTFDVGDSFRTITVVERDETSSAVGCGLVYGYSERLFLYGTEGTPKTETKTRTVKLIRIDRKP
ncbi:MAG: hypothetical protein MUC47_11025 [Candidatus Kapabacteria bacterium]|nr:hypothetical protein [Candidatus Kapabacteria bacterium]